MPEVQAPNLFGNFLAGRQAYQGEQQQAFQNQMAQRQAQMQETEFQQQQEAMARQQQFNQLAAQYLGPNDVQMAGGLPQGGDPYAAAATAGIPGQPQPQQGGPASFSQLVALDPQRAFQIRQAVAAEQEAAQAKRVQQAQQGILQAQYVLRSQAPAKLLKVGFPEIAESLKAEGIDIDTLDDDTVRQYATNVIETLGPIAGVGPAGDGDQFTLSEGQVRFDSQGRRIASVEKPPDAASEGEYGNKKFARANVLRDEFNAANKDFGLIQGQYNNILATAKEPSAAGDISLIFSYMKMLDPASTVREGEFATAQNASGVSDKVLNAYNRALDGKLLGDEAAKLRADFVKQAGNIYNIRKEQADKNRKRYSTLAKRADLDPLDVVGEEEVITETSAGAPRSFASEAEAEAAGIKPGTKVIIGGVSGTWQ